MGDVVVTHTDTAPVDVEVDLLGVVLSVTREPSAMPHALVALDAALGGLVTSLRRPWLPRTAHLHECRFVSGVKAPMRTSSVLVDSVGLRGLLRARDVTEAGERFATHVYALRVALAAVVLVEPDTMALGSTRAELEAAFMMGLRKKLYGLDASYDLRLLVLGSAIDDASAVHPTPTQRIPEKV